MADVGMRVGQGFDVHRYLVEAVGAKVVTVDGDSRNLKITDPHDLVTAAALLEDCSEAERRGCDS